jgi:endoglucanase
MAGMSVCLGRPYWQIVLGTIRGGVPMVVISAVLVACSPRNGDIPPSPAAVASPVAPVCGNQRCEPGEDTGNCPQDCPPHAFIRSEGTRLVDARGNPVQLRGVNLGGWLMWEGWIWGGGFNSETTVLERLEELVGQEQVAAFQGQIYANFITEADIVRIAELGFNVVRIPINHRALEEGGAYAGGGSGWEALDRLIEWCEAHGVYVILTLHGAPGGQSRLFTADPDGGARLWASGDHQERTVDLWRTLAERYRAREIVAGYDLLNEPNPGSGQDLVALYQRIIAAIRTVDPFHLIVLEGTDFASNFTMFEGPLDPNQAFSFHMYTWFRDNREVELAQYQAVAERHSVPMWNGEFGENEYERLESTVALFEDPQYNLAGWAFWPWKKVPNRYPYLRGIQTTEAWDKVIQWVAFPYWPNEKPSAEETRQGMDEFITAVRLENTDEDARMVEILTGWPR